MLSIPPSKHVWNLPFLSCSGLEEMREEAGRGGLGGRLPEPRWELMVAWARVVALGEEGTDSRSVLVVELVGCSGCMDTEGRRCPGCFGWQAPFSLGKAAFLPQAHVCRPLLQAPSWSWGDDTHQNEGNSLLTMDHQHPMLSLPKRTSQQRKERGWDKGTDARISLFPSAMSLESSIPLRALVSPSEQWECPFPPGWALWGSKWWAALKWWSWGREPTWPQESQQDVRSGRREAEHYGSVVCSWPGYGAEHITTGPWSPLGSASEHPGTGGPTRRDWGYSLWF